MNELCTPSLAHICSQSGKGELLPRGRGGSEILVVGYHTGWSADRVVMPTWMKSEPTGGSASLGGLPWNVPI